ncbi:MAG: SPOR domain-containing protein [Acidobacteriota bacterium]
MAKNEDGEVELVLGSKVLMGVFFLGAVLLGLSFLMGYVVGKGAAPVLTAQQAPREKTEPVAAITSPPVVEVTKVDAEPIKTAPQADVDSVPKEAEPAKVEPAKVDTRKADSEKAEKEQAEQAKAARARDEKAKADKAVAAKAKQESAKQEKAKLEREQKAKAEQAKTDKAKADKAQAEHAKADKGKAKAEPVKQAQGPAKGRSYLQLSATSKDEAESLANLLRSRGFTSLTAQIPEKPTLYRVLVGPIAPADAGRTRADLKAKSFAGADEAIIKAF